MKRFLSLALAALMTLAFLTACGSSGIKYTASKDTLAVCLASEPDTIDPALNSSVDGATLVIHAFAGLVKYTQDTDGSLKLVADVAKELPEGSTGTDGKVTYVFQLRDNLKWSDGSDLHPSDFVYSWNRAIDPATAADYEYMFDVIDGYDEGKLNVTADDTANTLTVVLKNSCPYFYELCAFPAYMPVQQATVEKNGEAWATDPSTYICNGPYTMTEWTHNSKIVYKKNPNYYDAASITMDTIEFYLSDDDNTMLANLKTGSWAFIDTVPNDEIKNLQAQYPDDFYITGQLGTYYVIFNVDKDLLPSDSTLEGADRNNANEDVRNALSLLIDRNYICEEIGKAGQQPASSYVAMGLTDADGKTQFYENAGSSKDYNGYFNVSKDAMESNIASALETLKKYYTYDDATQKFTNFPTMEYLYNTSTGHQQIAEYLQACFAAYGINMTLTNQEWNTFLNTRKDGAFTIARNGWLADYNDPMSFLDMWITASGNNDAQFGKGEDETRQIYSIDLTSAGIDYKVENGTWAETYDYVITLIKKTTDINTRYALMHLAEDLLMSSGAICPLYYYTDIYMCANNVKGAFSSPLGFKYFMYTTID